ncbi:MAG: hypothetical protein ACRD2C_13265 [Acidimicrobiales bacterium]
MTYWPELANGHEKAERLDGDLVTARELTASLPPAYSRETVELLVILNMVHTGPTSSGAAAAASASSPTS